MVAPQAHSTAGKAIAWPRRTWGSLAGRQGAGLSAGLSQCSWLQRSDDIFHCLRTNTVVVEGGGICVSA